MSEARAKAFGFYTPAAGAAPSGAEAAQALDVTRGAEAGGLGGDDGKGVCACGKCSAGVLEQCGPCEMNEERG
jgi:hypothetical protein